MTSLLLGVVTLDNDVFIFELKMDYGKPFDEVADEALNQIDANGYSERFAVSGIKPCTTSPWYSQALRREWWAGKFGSF